MKNVLSQTKDLRAGDRVMNWGKVRTVKSAKKAIAFGWTVVTFADGSTQAAASNMLIQVERKENDNG